MNPRQLEFTKKQRLFEKLSKQFGAPTKLQEAELRGRMEQAYAKVKAVRKVIQQKRKEPRGPANQRRRVSTKSRCG